MGVGGTFAKRSPGAAGQQLDHEETRHASLSVREGDKERVVDRR
ncbi:hypothetical protein ACNKHR_07965 [Shigella flexneri]